jgi:6-phosphofructokinase 2
MRTVVTLTLNPSVDESTTVERVLPEHKLRCAPPRYDPGGGGINVARVIRRLGGDCLALYPSGGLTGGLLEGLLQAEGVPHRAIAISGQTRINIHVEETATCAQYRFNMPGPELSDAEFLRCMDALGTLDPSPDYVVLSGSLPPGTAADGFARAARAARALGAKVVVDTSGPPLGLCLEQGVFLCKPNLQEMGELVGADALDEAGAAEAAAAFVAAGRAEAVVVTMAEAGALLVSCEGCMSVRPPSVPAVSKIGAGDSTVAGIMTQLARGGTLADAVRYGVACGTAAVLRDGTQLCRPEDVERLLPRVQG